MASTRHCQIHLLKIFLPQHPHALGVFMSRPTSPHLPRQQIQDATVKENPAAELSSCNEGSSSKNLDDGSTGLIGNPAIEDSHELPLECEYEMLIEKKEAVQLIAPSSRSTLPASSLQHLDFLTGINENTFLLPLLPASSSEHINQVKDIEKTASKQTVSNFGRPLELSCITSNDEITRNLFQLQHMGNSEHEKSSRVLSTNKSSVISVGFDTNTAITTTNTTQESEEEDELTLLQNKTGVSYCDISVLDDQLSNRLDVKLARKAMEKDCELLKKLKFDIKCVLNYNNIYKSQLLSISLALI